HNNNADRIRALVVKDGLKRRAVVCSLPNPAGRDSNVVPIKVRRIHRDRNDASRVQRRHDRSKPEPAKRTRSLHLTSPHLLLFPHGDSARPFMRPFPPELPPPACPRPPARATPARDFQNQNRTPRPPRVFPLPQKRTAQQAPRQKQ